MLYIKETHGIDSTWRVGEPIPDIVSRVVTFQADGDELEVILRALRGAKAQKGGTK